MTLAVRGSRIAIPGTALVLPDDGYATLVNCLVIRTGAGSGATGPTGGAAIAVGPAARLVLRGNVFSGYA